MPQNIESPYISAHVHSIAIIPVKEWVVIGLGPAHIGIQGAKVTLQKKNVDGGNSDGKTGIPRERRQSVLPFGK